MPTLEQNFNQWNKDYDWAQHGEEWSGVWGGSESQWFGTLFPRIHNFIPTKTILEIAPGFGRWTQYLKDYCEHLTVVDLSDRCIQACQDRFSAYSHITYHVNDGKSLAMVPDESIDFVFCFDSLVHAEADVLENYVREIATKLTSQGVGFIHHSNLGAYIDKETGDLLPDVKNLHWRAKSMSAELFEEYCEGTELQCIGQELVNWGGDVTTDCLSVFTRKTSNWARTNQKFENPNFMSEAKYIAKLAPLYSTLVFSKENTKEAVATGQSKSS